MTMNQQEIDRLFDKHGEEHTQIEVAQDNRAADMPTEKDALIAMYRAHERLRYFGWDDAKFCPKDGTFFHAVEAGSTGIHVCNYDGEWPKGRWWIYYEGDVCPARPILWRPIKEQPTLAAQPQEGGK